MAILLYRSSWFLWLRFWPGSFGVPFLYLLANRFGPDAMYWSYGIGWAVACALSVYHYAAGKWRGKYRSE